MPRKEGSGGSEFKFSLGIAVFGSSGEVAVADCNSQRVRFSDEGEREERGKLQAAVRHRGRGGRRGVLPSYRPHLGGGAHGNLLVVDMTNHQPLASPEGKHLWRTRSDLRLEGGSEKGVAWSADGGIAVASKVRASPV
jgi:hypothetical protein